MKVPDERHAQYASGGVKLAFGRRWDGNIVHVSTVSSGSSCECRCPACGAPLIARLGSRRHHFSHAPGTQASSGEIACGGGQMTALHSFACDLVSSRRDVTLPACEVFDGKRFRTRFGVRRIRFENARTEAELHGYRADVILRSDDRDLVVEVYVTHPCTPEKILAMKAAGTSLLEIDLSAFDGRRSLGATPLSTLENAILHEAPRRWLSNRHLDALADAIERERRERREAFGREFAKRYARSEKRALADDPTSDEWFVRATRLGWGRSLPPAPDGAAGLFTVHPRRWCIRIAGSYLSSSVGMTVKEVADALWRDRLLDNELAGAIDDDPALGPLVGASPDGVEGTVKLYLDDLVRHGAATIRNGRWFQSEELSKTIRTEAQREQAVAEGNARVRKLVDMLKRIAELSKLDCSWGGSNAYTVWIDSPLWRSTPRKIARRGEDQWEELRLAVTKIMNAFTGNRSQIPDCLGLPGARQAMQAAFDHRETLEWERREAERRVQEERLKHERLELDARHATARIDGTRRINEIRANANAYLREGAVEWLQTPLRQTGSTPLEESMKSVAGLDRSNEALEAAFRAQKKRKRLLDDLKAFAATCEPHEGKRDLLLRSANRSLPEQTSLIEFRQDQGTLDRCKEVLRSYRNPRRR